MDIIFLLKNLIWPALATVSVISLLDFIVDGKRRNKILFIVFAILSISALVYAGINYPMYIFLQLYLFTFCLSISLVILALKKSIDAYTIIGIFLMLVMLILLLRFNLI